MTSFAGFTGGPFSCLSAGAADDTWTPTTLTNAPVVRSGHTAMWTGSEMIVLGGYSSGGGWEFYWNTGGRYDPSTDSWTPTTTTGAPAGRDRHTAMWTGSEMIVWGGAGYLNTGGRYKSQHRQLDCHQHHQRACWPRQ